MIRIPATKRRAILVDEIDADLAKHRWSIHGKGSPMRSAKKGEYLYIHRVILERALGRALAANEICDHKDGNTLNNTRANLRLSTISQNNANSKKRKGTLSSKKGVSWSHGAKKWRARIRVNGKEIHLGVFISEEEAHTKYCEAAKQYFGEFARFE